MEYGENADASTEAVSISGDLHQGLGDSTNWSRSTHTALQKLALALNQERLLHIKLELSNLMQRCA